MGGLPFTRPDQHYEPPAAGLVPGSRSSVFKKLVVVAGAGGGLFVYSGAPAAGNLIATIAGAAGTDVYGNQYLTGITGYAPGATAMQILNGQLNTYTFTTTWVFDDSFTGSTINLQSAEQFFLKIGALDAFDVSASVADLNVPVNLTAAVAVTASALAATMLQMFVLGDTNPRFIFDTTAAPTARFRIGSGTATPDVNIARTATGVLVITVSTGNLLQVASADLDVNTVGRGLQVAEGANAKQGTATLAAGTVTVANTSVTANSRIFLTAQTTGAGPGALRVSARTAGTSFTITSTNAADTSLVAYEIFEPG